MGKGEIARYEQFLLCPQCFLKTCTADTKKNQGLFGNWLNIISKTNKQSKKALEEIGNSLSINNGSITTNLHKGKMYLSYFCAIGWQGAVRVFVTSSDSSGLDKLNFFFLW